MDKIQIVDDVKTNSLSTKEPECMKNRPTVDPSRQSLTNEELKEAKTVLLNKSYTTLSFPRTIKMRKDPPLAQQNYYVFAFTPSKDAIPDKDGCFGVLKFRGTFPSVTEAEEWADNIITNVDSFNENIIGYVGTDFPLTLDSKYCLSTKEVDVRMKLDNITKNSIKQQREKEKKEMDEIQERQRQLLADTTELKQIATDDLDYYIQLRVKRANARMLQEECEKKMKEAAKIIKKTISEISDLDDNHPEYKQQYEEKYKNALESIGGDTHNNKMIEYMK